MFKTNDFYKKTKQNACFSILFLGFVLFLVSCQQPKQWIDSGEYSHGLHLSTRDDGTFYAWLPDSLIHDSLHFALLCVPHYPQANVVGWRVPHQSPSFFGVLTHLGNDSFRIKMETPINSSPFAQALASEQGLFFKIEKRRDDWRNFYFFNDVKSAIIYEKPDFKSKKHTVSVKTRLYSSELVGEWAKIKLDTAIYRQYYWVHRSSVY